MNWFSSKIERSQCPLAYCFLLCVTAIVCCLLVLATEARADVKSKAAQEAAEAVMQKFGRQVVREGVASLAQRIESFAAKYGDEVLVAVRKCGPEALTLVEGAGTNGAKAAQLLARYGEEGATAVLRRPKGLAQFVRFGEGAATVLIKHPGVGEQLIEKGGASAIKALEAVGPRNGRRLAMLMEGELVNAGESTALLEVIAKYGDRGAEFVWNNKGALAVGATLTAFVANPEAFIGGAERLTRVAGESVAKPLAEGIASGTNWNLVILPFLAAIGCAIAVKLGLFRKPDPEPAPAKS